MALLANQARSYATAIHQVARDVFKSGNPADRVVNAYFRDIKKLGSRDRRMIAETLFSLFRWWGWLRQLLEDSQSLWDDGGERSEEWARLLYAAHLLDNAELHPVAQEWQQTANLPHISHGMGALTLAEKSRRLRELFRATPFDAAALVPGWLQQCVPLDEQAYLSFLAYLQQRPPLWLRAQVEREALILELRSAGLVPTLTAMLPQALCLEQARVNLFELQSFRDGKFELQDFASQMIGIATQAKPGERWWDACAGAGGKTLQLAAMMQNKGTLIASDIREYKLLELRKRARRAQFSNISPRPWNEAKLPVKHGSVDGVLVDAPCTGTGTWRRNPDCRWTAKAEDVAEMAQLQLDILSRASKAAKPGGVVVYATCSVCEAENEAVVRAFLAQRQEFTLEGWQNPLTGTLTDGMLRVWPMDANCDATFAARFRRNM
ncbi:NOL1/NOP2/sun family putative RNA methylase [Candidatus Moduliflexus flocculans]|uniref:NOL1/NOP2/sun family putative RNA methylase n=1 Tax=Candidatus Moduliflexus flocculans TaxID=1499966 RepID=A0A081BLN9_9BACT|nr:NOL1/NOP2/sun family putative RNA methylase [Candidatus Moduliflexus flocculans]